MMKKLPLILIIAAVIGAIFYFDLTQYLSLDYVKNQQQAFSNYYDSNPFMCITLFFIIYVAITALSIPGAAVLTLLAGALFGLINGTLIVSFASSIGATLAFLASRFLLRESIQKKFSSHIDSINKGVEKDGALYLFTLRLIPAIPFFVINLVMGLTSMKTAIFYVVSQLGMLAGTIVFVNAGTQLAQISSLSGILSPKLIASFALLGLFPIVIKIIVGYFQSRKLYRNFKKPKSFEYNMVVIGAGSAGLVTSYICAATKGKVALIEKHKMGGDCLNTGCVPSKALIRSGKFIADARKAESLGFKSAKIDFKFSDIMDRVQRVIKTIEPHDSIERFSSLGVDCHTGEAKIMSPYEVQVNGKILTARNIVVATGARPFIPQIPGLDEVDFMTSDNVWDMREKPKKLLVLGGGPIGTELVQAFQRLVGNVTQIERGSRILGREDIEVSQLIHGKLEKEGVNILLEHNATRFFKKDGKNYLECDHKGEKVQIEFDKVLLAIGRAANTSGFGLEDLDVKLTERKTIKVDDYLRTNYKNIYACGDVAGPYQFTHTAAHQAWFCAVNTMLKPFYGFKADYRVIPWCTYTDPEVARVGINEMEAKEQGIKYDVTNYGIDDLDRAITDETAYGFVKVLTVPGSDKILGVTIVGVHAGDIIAEYVSAMKHGFGMNKILGTIHIYPTLAEANKFAAGNWKKSQVTESTLKLGQRFNRWRRDIL